MQSVDALPWPEAMPMDADVLTVERMPSFGTDRIWYVDTFFLNGRPLVGSPFAYFYRSGWPLRSFEGGHYLHPETNKMIDAGAMFLAADWADEFWGVDSLPLRPVWVGIVLSTLFYAALLWLVAYGPFALRRTIRRKRGHCINCNYNLRGEFTHGCPECGWNREDATA